MSLIAISAKAEWHLGYSCDLRCSACSRATWMKKHPVADMTLDDAKEFIRQADEIGWKGFQPEKEKARIIIIGGEPTLHPRFHDLVKLAMDWSGTYAQIFSNGHTPEAKAKLERARMELSASINTDCWKAKSFIGTENGWDTNCWVSPIDAGIGPAPECYVHPSQICGFLVDHEGYAPCPIGGCMCSLQGNAEGRTRRLADLFNEEKARILTEAGCRHCGYELLKRPISKERKAQFVAYAKACPTIHGGKMSPTWEKIFKERETLC